MFFIPYKCRCEAIGGNRRRGERYKCLNGGWEKITPDRAVFERKFDLNSTWKGLLVYLNLNSESRQAFSVNVNGRSVEFGGETDITELTEKGENVITVEFGNTASDEEIKNILKSLCLTARPAKHIGNAEVFCESQGENAVIRIKAELAGRLDLGGMPRMTAEIYDEELDAVASAEGDFVKTEKGCFAELSVKLENVKTGQAEKPYRYTLLLLCGGETLRRSVIVCPETEGGCIIGEPLREECRGFRLEADGKDLFRPLTYLKLQLLEGRNGVITVKNISDGDIGGDTVRYEIYNQRGLYGEGETVLSEMAPGGLSILNLGYEIPEISPFEYFLNVEYRGGTEQFKLPVRQTVCEKSYSDDMPDIACEERENGVLAVRGENFLYEFDLVRGGFKKMSADGVEFTEAVDGLKNIGEVSCKLLAAGRKCVAVSGAGRNDNGEFSVMWIIFGSGEVSVSVSAMKANETLGIIVKPREDFYDMQFFGDIDCGGSSFAGIYEKENYRKEKALAYGNIRWALFKDGEGRGLLIKGVEPFDGEKNADNEFCFKGAGEIGAHASSFSVRPIFIEDEDVVREARTLPAVAVAKNDGK